MALKKDGNMMNVVLWVLVFIGILYFFKPHVEELRAYLNDLVFPVKKGIYGATVSTKGNLSKIMYMKDLISEKERLEKEVYRLQVENLQLRGMATENARLKTLLDLKNKKIFDFIVAKVVFRDPMTIYDYLYIDKGLKDGIKKDMVVLNKNALLGRIVEVEYDRAKVELLTRKGFSVSVTSKDGNNLAILKGEGGPKMTMEYLIAEVSTKKGDFILTSGIIDIYPKNIFVGKISENNSERDNLFKEEEVQIPYSMINIEEVIVLKK